MKPETMVKILEAAQSDVDRAYEALKASIEEFVPQLVVANVDDIKNTIEYAAEFPPEVTEQLDPLIKSVLPETGGEQQSIPWSLFRGNFDKISANELLNSAYLRQADRPQLAQKMDESQWLVDTAQELLDHLAKTFNSKPAQAGTVVLPAHVEGAGPAVTSPVEAPAEVTTQEIVLERWQELQAKVKELREVTETWVIYQVAWEQRQDASPLRKAVLTGDRLVDHYYRVAEQKDLDVENQRQLITVLYLNRLYTHPTAFPAPYIVGPLWGYQQTWNLLSYGHEVGHHLYRNVSGLSDELLVTLLFGIGLQKSQDTVRMWANWLEELFADMFGLLRGGPGVVHSMQRLAFWVLPPVRPFQAPANYFTQIMLSGEDETHPSPSLRVYLMLKALQIVQAQKKFAFAEFEDLQRRWQEVHEGEEEKIYLPNKSSRKLKATLKTGQQVLELMLTTPLFALADPATPKSARSMIDVFFNEDLVSDRVKKVRLELLKALEKNTAPALAEADILSIVLAAEFALDSLPGSQWEKLNGVAQEALLMSKEMSPLQEMF